MTITLVAFGIALMLLAVPEVLGYKLARSAFLSAVDDAIATSGSLLRKAFSPDGHATYLVVGPHVRLPKRTPGATPVPKLAGLHTTPMPRWVMWAGLGHRVVARRATRVVLRWRWYIETYVLDDTLLADWTDLSLPEWNVSPGRHRPWSPTARTMRRPYEWSWANEPTGAYAILSAGLDHADVPIAGTDRCWLTPVQPDPSWMYLGLPIRVGRVPGELARLRERVAQVQAQLTEDAGPAVLRTGAAAGPAQPPVQTDRGVQRATERPRPHRPPRAKPAQVGARADRGTAHAPAQLARVRPAVPLGHIP